MFRKKDKTSTFSKSNGSQMRELNAEELSSVNGAGPFIWVRGEKSGRGKGIAGGIGYEIRW